MSLYITPETHFSNRFLSLMVYLQKAKSSPSEEIFFSIVTCQKSLELNFNKLSQQIAINPLDFESALSIATAKTNKFLKRFFLKNTSSSPLEVYSLTLRQNYLFFGKLESHPLLACLAPDYPCKFEFGGIQYPSALHAFTAQTFHQNSTLQQKCADSSREELFKLAIENNNTNPYWHGSRENTLFHIFCAKFGQNTELQQSLRATVDTCLIFTENLKKGGNLWDIGCQGKGSNKIGQILMQVREHYGGIGKTPLSAECLQKLEEISPKTHLEALDRSDGDITKEHAALNAMSCENESESLIHQKPENQSKNQGHYPHCIYDKTLVPLSTGCYINANFMLANSIIATQSPMANTNEDFWQMALDQKCISIVMLNSPSDITHHVYYPQHENSPKCFGTIQVELVQETIKIDPSWKQSPHEEEPHGLKIRILNIKKGDETHTLTHYQYINWRDNMVGSEGCVAELVATIYQHQDSNPSPMIVHCLSGIGRTGTFATIYNQYCKWKKNELLDIRKCVEEQRSPEAGRYSRMVPLVAQYRFCYHALQYIVCSSAHAT
jgi:protein tyrosine phosphatase/predicted NAD-dependent protein-ADP-ribosyltransferase YbiA (DUF1768 family)